MHQVRQMLMLLPWQQREAGEEDWKDRKKDLGRYQVVLTLLSLKMPLTESTNTGTEGKHTENIATFLHMLPIVEIKAKSLRLGWFYYWLSEKKKKEITIKRGI